MILAGACALIIAARGAGPIFFGDFRSIRSVALSSRGETWAATAAGLVQLSRGDPPRTFGWSGLIAGHGLDDVWQADDQIFVSGGPSVARLADGHLVPELQTSARTVKPISATTEGRFEVPDRPSWNEATINPPPTCGTHVSAVTGSADELFAAWYGDKLWRLSRSGWSPVAGQPDGLSHVSSLASSNGDLALSTFEGDLWSRLGGIWIHQQLPDGPRGSIYSLVGYHGSILAGSFENGISAFSGIQWKQLNSETASGANPRQMVSFKGSLYARMSTGQVDRIDGDQRSGNVFPWLLRGQATCLGTGDGRLLVGQYGGWSEYDGKVWTHFLKLPGLEGKVVTALAGRKGEVWIGTQGSGLLRFDRRSKKLLVYDQRQGLGDDWVRSLLIDDRGVVAGLFLTGAYVLRGSSFHRLTASVRGEALGLVRDPRSKLYIGSRQGVWRIDGDRSELVTIAGVDDLEIQCVLGTRTGLWLGLPNGVAYVPWATLGASENKAPLGTSHNGRAGT